MKRGTMYNYEILVVRIKSQYNALTVFEDELIRNWIDFGMKVSQIDNLDEVSVKKAAEQTYDAVIVMNGAAVDRLEHLFQSPVYAYYVDHPLRHDSRLKATARQRCIFVNEDFKSYADKHYDFTHDAEVVMQAGVEGKYSERPFSQRKYPVVFCGSYEDCHSILQRIDDNEETFRKFLHLMIEIAIGNPCLRIEDVFDVALKEFNCILSDAEYTELMYGCKDVELYLRRYYRSMVIKQLVESGIPVEVYGENWELLDCGRKEMLHCHPPVDYREMLDVFADAQIVINVMPWAKNGFHDRIACGMLNGAMVISDETSYMREEGLDGEKLALYSLDRIEQLPDKVAYYLEHLDEAERIAKQGYAWAKERHTWRNRAEQFIEFFEKMDSDVRVNKTIAKDGTEILEFCRQDKLYRMNSLYRPTVEAERFAAPFKDMDAGSVLIVFGYGNGIFPRALMEACGEDVTVIFYEPEMSVWEGIGNSPEDVSQVLGIRGYLVTGERFGKGFQYRTTIEFFDLLQEVISYFNHEKVSVVTLPKYGEVFPEQLQAFEGKIQFRLGRVRSNVMTAKYMGHEAVVNNIMNLQCVPDSYCADSFQGVFPKNMPAIVVASGPSLEKNVKVLKKAKGHALILCVDTAIRYLLKENIIPDLIVCVDPALPLKYVDVDGADRVPIVGSVDMNYEVLQRVPNSKVIFASTENPCVKTFYQRSGHEISQLKSGGSVATFAFSLCLYWGFRNVILIGQDLALAGKQQYAGTMEISTIADIEDRNNLLEVEDIYGNTIYTIRDYYAYLKWFEQTIAVHPEIRVIDATEGGAKIAGTEIMTLENALREYGDENLDFEGCMKETPPAFSPEEKIEIRNNIQERKKVLETLRQRLTVGVELSKKGIQFAQQGVEKVSEYEDVDKGIQEICQFYDTLDESFFIQREIDATHLDEFIELFENQEAYQRKERYERLEKYFGLLLEATSTVDAIWEKLRR
jgi:glycosyltransferase involved in cell wall biosynthesis